MVKAFGGQRAPFAAPLKKMLEAIGVPAPALYGSQEDKATPLELFGGKSARQAMQTLGTEWGRLQFGPDFWCRAWGASVDRDAWQPGAVVVADDVRFRSEFDAIKARGGVVIQLIRSEEDLKRVPRHPSEDFQAVPFDIRIINDGTKRQLAAKLRKAIGQYCKPYAVEPAEPPKRKRGAAIKRPPAGEVKLVTEGRKSRFVPAEQASGE